MRSTVWSPAANDKGGPAWWGAALVSFMYSHAMDELHVGQQRHEGRVVSVVCRDNEVVHVGLRGPIDQEGYALHWGAEAVHRTDGGVKLQATTRQHRRYVGSPGATHTI